MKKTTNYFITMLVALVITALVAWQRGLFQAETAAMAMAALSDGFFTAGIILAGIGAISWASMSGVYDIFRFGSGRAVRWFVPTMDKEKYEDFYRYKQEKEQKGRTWKPHLLWGGLSSLFLAVILYIFYQILNSSM